MSSLCSVVQVDVVNRGFGGYNTRWGVKLLEQVLQEVKGRQVALMTIWFGANDAAIPGRSGYAITLVWLFANAAMPVLKLNIHCLLYRQWATIAFNRAYSTQF
eukprot:GHRR01032960.1.p1 GENE.GHRR01032960.1~~GHRR01032960.1.p1  ORF type:complete len:103 (+),score=28.19 GHRR01032960.1:867-1175(+)